MHAESEAVGVTFEYEAAFAEGTGIGTNELSEWRDLCRIFDDMPFHEVPDYRLYRLLRDAARSSKVIRASYEPICKTHAPITEQDIRIVKAEAETLTACYEEAAALSNELAGVNIRGRARLAWRKLKSMLRN